MTDEKWLRDRIAKDKAKRKARKAEKSKLNKAIRAVTGRINRLNAVIAKRSKKLAAIKEDGRRRAVKWALEQVGTREQPEGSNRGPKVDKWSVATLGYSGFAWCQSFANAVLVAGGGQQLKSAYTVAVVQWAREKKLGLSIVPISQRRPGDFVFFKWPGVSGDFCDHVGVDVGDGWTVEGNTSSGSTGSQNNGSGVWRRKRGNAYIVAVVRPTYN